MFINIFKPRTSTLSADVNTANIRYLYSEILFAAILGAIMTYNSLFALRLGATASLLGILSSAPALVTAILSVPSARYLETRKNRKQWLLHSLLFMRAGQLVLVVLPTIAPDNAAIFFVAWVVVLIIPNAFFANGFNAMLGDIIPEDRRAFVFSRRTIIWSLVTVAVLTVVGAYLDTTTALFPFNYQALYLFGIVTSIGSQIYLHKLVVPKLQALSTPQQATPVTRMPLSREMKKTLLNTFVYQFGINLPGPLFVLHYVNTLHVSDGAISINNAAGTLGAVFGYVVWEAITRRRGFFWGMRTAAIMTWILPFTVAFAQSFPLIIAANIAVNLIHPGMDLSIINVVFKLSTPEQRNMSLSYYTTALNLSAFAAPLIAVPLSGLIGIPGAMLCAAALRLLGGIMFQVNRVQDPAPEPILQAASVST